MSQPRLPSGYIEVMTGTALAVEKLKTCQEHQDHIAESNRRWRGQHPDWNDRRKMTKFFSDANKRGLIVELSEDEIVLLFKSPCAYCGARLGLNGIDRVNNAVGYIKHNCVACCSNCNFMKHTKTKEIFLQQVKRIYENLNLSDSN